MMLLLDLNHRRNSLSRYEFVDPIASTIEQTGPSCEILHYKDATGEMVERFVGVVLCGTPLKDNAYARDVEAFAWLRECNVPVLGICAGMQTMASVFGARLVPWYEIGLKKVDIVEATPLLGEPRQIEGYHLHNFGVTQPSDFLVVAGRPDRPEAFRHRQRPIYGILFHPEVRNQWIIERFARLC